MYKEDYRSIPALFSYLKTLKTPLDLLLIPLWRGFRSIKESRTHALFQERFYWCVVLIYSESIADFTYITK